MEPVVVAASSEEPSFSSSSSITTTTTTATTSSIGACFPTVNGNRSVGVSGPPDKTRGAEGSRSGVVVVDHDDDDNDAGLPPPPSRLPNRTLFSSPSPSPQNRRGRSGGAAGAHSMAPPPPAPIEASRRAGTSLNDDDRRRRRPHHGEEREKDNDGENDCDESYRRRPGDARADTYRPRHAAVASSPPPLNAPSSSRNYSHSAPSGPSPPYGYDERHDPPPTAAASHHHHYYYQQPPHQHQQQRHPNYHHEGGRTASAPPSNPPHYNPHDPRYHTHQHHHGHPAYYHQPSYHPPYGPPPPHHHTRHPTRDPRRGYDAYGGEGDDEVNRRKPAQDGGVGETGSVNRGDDRRRQTNNFVDENARAANRAGGRGDSGSDDVSGVGGVPTEVKTSIAAAATANGEDSVDNKRLDVRSHDREDRNNDNDEGEVMDDSGDPRQQGEVRSPKTSRSPRSLDRLASSSRNGEVDNGNELSHPSRACHAPQPPPPLSGSHPTASTSTFLSPFSSFSDRSERDRSLGPGNGHNFFRNPPSPRDGGVAIEEGTPRNTVTFGKDELPRGGLGTVGRSSIGLDTPSTVELTVTPLAAGATPSDLATTETTPGGNNVLSSSSSFLADHLSGISDTPYEYRERAQRQRYYDHYGQEQQNDRHSHPHDAANLRQHDGHYRRSSQPQDIQLPQQHYHHQQQQKQEQQHPRSTSTASSGVVAGKGCGTARLEREDVLPIWHQPADDAGGDARAGCDDRRAGGAGCNTRGRIGGGGGVVNGLDSSTLRCVGSASTTMTTTTRAGMESPKSPTTSTKSTAGATAASAAVTANPPSSPYDRDYYRHLHPSEAGDDEEEDGDRGRDRDRDRDLGHNYGRDREDNTGVRDYRDSAGHYPRASLNKSYRDPPPPFYSASLDDGRGHRLPPPSHPPSSFRPDHREDPRIHRTPAASRHRYGGCDARGSMPASTSRYHDDQLTPLFGDGGGERRRTEDGEPASLSHSRSSPHDRENIFRPSPGRSSDRGRPEHVQGREVDGSGSRQVAAGSPYGRMSYSNDRGVGAGETPVSPGPSPYSYDYDHGIRPRERDRSGHKGGRDYDYDYDYHRHPAYDEEGSGGANGDRYEPGTQRSASDRRGGANGDDMRSDASSRKGRGVIDDELDPYHSGKRPRDLEYASPDVEVERMSSTSSSRRRHCPDQNQQQNQTLGPPANGHFSGTISYATPIMRRTNASRGGGRDSNSREDMADDEDGPRGESGRRTEGTEGPRTLAGAPPPHRARAADPGPALVGGGSGRTLPQQEEHRPSQPPPPPPPPPQPVTAGAISHPFYASYGPPPPHHSGYQPPHPPAFDARGYPIHPPYRPPPGHPSSHGHPHAPIPYYYPDGGDGGGGSTHAGPYSYYQQQPATSTASAGPQPPLPPPPECQPFDRSCADSTSAASFAGPGANKSGVASSSAVGKSNAKLKPKSKSSKSKAPRRKKMYSDYIGVTYNKTHAKYQACITHYRKQHYLGRYRLAVDAARAYDESAKLLKGPGWKINFGSEEEYERAKRREMERLDDGGSGTPVGEIEASCGGDGASSSSSPPRGGDAAGGSGGPPPSLPPTASAARRSLGPPVSVIIPASVVSAAPPGAVRNAIERRRENAPAGTSVTITMKEPVSNNSTAAATPVSGLMRPVLVPPSAMAIEPMGAGESNEAIGSKTQATAQSNPCETFNASGQVSATATPLMPPRKIKDERGGPNLSHKGQLLAPGAGRSGMPRTRDLADRLMTPSPISTGRSSASSGPPKGASILTSEPKIGASQAKHETPKSSVETIGASGQPPSVEGKASTPSSAGDDATSRGTFVITPTDGPNCVRMSNVAVEKKGAAVKCSGDGGNETSSMPPPSPLAKVGPSSSEKGTRTAVIAETKIEAPVGSQLKSVVTPSAASSKKSNGVDGSTKIDNMEMRHGLRCSGSSDAGLTMSSPPLKKRKGVHRSEEESSQQPRSKIKVNQEGDNTSSNGATTGAKPKMQNGTLAAASALMTLIGQ